MFKKPIIGWLLLTGVCTGCGETRALSVAVTDTIERIDRRIAPGLQLEVRRDGTYTSTAGWDVAVYATADTARENLLYHSREWHGPYPTQIYAWSEAQNYFGDGPRELPVRGHQWLVVLECVACTTDGTGDAAHFTGGRLTVEWRPAPDR